MRKAAVILLMIGCTLRLLAQQDAQFSQYIFNGLIINPAYAGSRGTLSANTFIRSQWTGMEGAPLSQTLSMHAPSKNERYGFGLNFTNDRTGYLNQQWLNGVYALRIRTEKITVALGLQGGFYIRNLQWAKADPLTPDPVAGTKSMNTLSANAGTGVFLYGKRYYVGFSVPHIFGTRFTSQVVIPPSLPQSYLRRNYLLTAGVVLGMQNDIKFKPTILLKYTEGGRPVADLNLMILLNSRLWTGVSYRTSGMIVGMAEFQISPMFRAGYAFDYSLSPVRTGTWGTHELNIGFDLRNKNHPLKNPRYW